MMTTKLNSALQTALLNEWTPYWATIAELKFAHLAELKSTHPPSISCTELAPLAKL
jgi:hypothetical protein